ncbi:MAG: hypothetical protein K940chlam6_00084 [Chlamydiae bacterium]|nr:hypothetical protein [Chlamydiota bacterium]
MAIGNDFLNNFSKEVENASPGKLKEILLSGRAVRVESAQKNHFWDFEQKKLHHDFDTIYTQGVGRLAESIPSKLPKLIDRIVPKFPLEAKDAGKAVAVGVAGFAGWLVGWVYNNSLSHLILHEYGHAWAANQIYHGANPTVSTGAQHWLNEGNWYNWFWGIRKGAPGNFTSYSYGPGTDFGNLLSPLERNLFISSAGLGIELALNTTLAGLGLIAIKKKHRALGASLIGFSIVSHSGAHSYIRRFPELLDAWSKQTGGDPPKIASLLSELWNISKVEAFRFLWYGYMLFPIFLIAFLAILIIKPHHDIPDECVLMRLLTAENKSLPLQKILTEVELEMASECKQMEKLPKEEKEKLTIKVCDALLAKIKKNDETRSLFKETRSEISKEIKGKNHKSFTFRIKEIASLAAFAAYQVRSLELINAFSKTFYFLSGLFLVAQAICVLLDSVQTIKDVANEKLSTFAKCISIAKMSLSIVTLIVITPTLFIAGAAGYAMPFFLAAAVMRLALGVMNHFEMRRISASTVAGKKENSVLSST